MTNKAHAPRIAEIAADEGYNLAGAPVLLAKLTAYVSRPVFAQLAAIATACQGEYSKHNAGFMFQNADARESFAAQARVILTAPPTATAPEAPRTATQARAQSNRAARSAQTTAEARAYYARNTAPTPAPAVTFGEAPAQAYTDAPTIETPPAIRVSTSRPIASTMTDRTPAGYGPSPEFIAACKVPPPAIDAATVRTLNAALNETLNAMTTANVREITSQPALF